MSVNWTDCPRTGFVGLQVKLATGMPPLTVTVFSPRELPLALAEVSLTRYEPPEAKVWVGFLRVDVPPSPKFHNQDVGLFVDVSVNETDCPAAGFVGSR